MSDASPHGQPQSVSMDDIHRSFQIFAQQVLGQLNEITRRQDDAQKQLNEITNRQHDIQNQLNEIRVAQQEIQNQLNEMRVAQQDIQNQVNEIRVAQQDIQNQVNEIRTDVNDSVHDQTEFYNGLTSLIRDPKAMTQKVWAKFWPLFLNRIDDEQPHRADDIWQAIAALRQGDELPPPSLMKLSDVFRITHSPFLLALSAIHPRSTWNETQRISVLDYALLEMRESSGQQTAHVLSTYDTILGSAVQVMQGLLKANEMWSAPLTSCYHQLLAFVHGYVKARSDTSETKLLESTFFRPQLHYKLFQHLAWSMRDFAADVLGREYSVIPLAEVQPVDAFARGSADMCLLLQAAGTHLPTVKGKNLTFVHTDGVLPPHDAYQGLVFNLTESKGPDRPSGLDVDAVCQLAHYSWQHAAIKRPSMHDQASQDSALKEKPVTCYVSAGSVLTGETMYCIATESRLVDPRLNIAEGGSWSVSPRLLREAAVPTSLSLEKNRFDTIGAEGDNFCARMILTAAMSMLSTASAEWKDHASKADSVLDALLSYCAVNVCAKSDNFALTAAERNLLWETGFNGPLELHLCDQGQTPMTSET